MSNKWHITSTYSIYNVCYQYCLRNIKLRDIMLKSRLLSSIHFLPDKWLPNIILHQQIRQKHIHALNRGQAQLMMNILGVSYRKTHGILSQHLNLRTIDQDLLCKSANMLEKFGIIKEDIFEHPQVLAILPVTIENHAMLLQESGFTAIRAEHLLSYFAMWKKPVRLLKAHNYIPDDVEVSENFFTFLKNPPPSIGVHNSDDCDFLNKYLTALNHYLCWKLGVSQKELDRIMTTYPRLRNRSFRLMEMSLEVLEEKLDFSIDKIRRHAYLIYAHPENTLNSLYQVKSLGGLSIKDVFHKYPKIIMTQTDTLLKTSSHLKDFGIPDSAIVKCPELFTLSSETVKDRLRALRSVPEFIGLIKHPRVLRLVHHQRKARTRLTYLREMNFKCVSLHLLQSSQKVFEKYIRDGLDRTNGSDVIGYLSTELNYCGDKIRKLLHRHPFWCQVPLVTVRETLTFLQKRGFTRDQILLNIQAVLYSSKQLEKELNGLPAHPELNTENQKHIGGNASRLQNLPLAQQLALSMYFIERDFHFSGDGIWYDNTAVVATAATS